MSPYALVIDDFLADFVRLREYADIARFEDVENPVDQVVYPQICRQLPRNVEDEIQDKLAGALCVRVHVRALFMRRSAAGVPAPHQAHTDLAMGRWSLMLYMNRPAHCQGGTSLVRHKTTTLAANPVDAAQLELWRRDANTPDAWAIELLCPMRANRAFIFPAHLMHRAEPVGGFGADAHDARLVLTAFFDDTGPA